MVLIDKFGDDQSVALFYVRKTVENGWSRAMLENNIASNLHLRQGNAETNFDLQLLTLLGPQARKAGGKMPKCPTSWSAAYPDATWGVVNRENYASFI